MQSKAATVEEYIASLPEDRRATVEAVRRVFRENMSSELQEGMQYGMIGYSVPHSVYPAGYHCDPKQPLPYAGIAAQKGYYSMYLCGLYSGGSSAVTMTRWFRAAWEKTGKKLDMGKACVRFKRLEDVPLEVVGELIRRVPMRDYIAMYERERAAMGERAGARKAVGGKKKAAKKKAAKKKVVKKKVGRAAAARTAGSGAKRTGAGKKAAKKRAAR